MDFRTNYIPNLAYEQLNLEPISLGVSWLAFRGVRAFL